MTENYEAYFSGKKLYGDDFSQSEIEDWFADESEGYADLGARDKVNYAYGYHQLNRYHAFRFIKGSRFDRALGIGSAYGDEFEPISKQIGCVTILDPSGAFSYRQEVLGIPCVYKKPSISGDIAFDENSFDLITSLGVMHHIPNVSHVIAECYRCLDRGGIMLLREPICSMGDWRRPRVGLTKRERGIPVKVLDQIIQDAGFVVVRKKFCNFPLVHKVANMMGITTYNSYIFTMMDALLSRCFSWNIQYHRTKTVEKFAPSSVFYILKK